MKENRNEMSAVLGWAVAGVGAAAVAVFAAPVAFTVLAIETAAGVAGYICGAIVGVTGVSLLGGVVGYKISDLIQSEVW